jgi:hypothetical protein
MRESYIHSTTHEYAWVVRSAAEIAIFEPRITGNWRQNHHRLALYLTSRTAQRYIC